MFHIKESRKSGKTKSKSKNSGKGKSSLPGFGHASDVISQEASAP
jgi:hypothetical protein